MTTTPKPLAVVTGATKGLGKAIATCFINKGLRVIGTGRSLPQEAISGVEYHQLDCNDPISVETCCKLLKSIKPDILVNNAGINRINPFETISVEEFIEINRVNLVAPFQLTQACIAAMKHKGWGRIVNVASIFGKVGREQRCSYSASKFGLDGLTASLAAEVARDGILVNCVSPGFIDTQLTRSILGNAGMQQVTAQIPLGRLAQADEIARFVVWLASQENTYISGQNIAIDGGFTRV